MKIFSWVQNKLTGKKPNPNINNQQPSKEEFNDWHHGLLTIGTFGNKVKQEEADDQKANPLASTQDHHVNYLHGLTPDEVGKLQKELNLIFQEHHGGTGPTPSSSSAGLERTDVPLDRFLDDEERVCGGNSDGLNSINKKDDHCSNKTSLVQSRGKDIYLDNTKAAIGKKSLSFLLKKMFVCRGGFSPAPISLRDPIMESRMEKMLKALLHKKIYPQNYGTKLSTKKSLESNSHMAKTSNGDEKNDKADDGSKWVKTDSEYIVLEI